MAENLQKSDNSQKIACRSRQAVNFKSRIIFESLKDSLDKNEERTEQGRRLYLQKFEEIYEKISQENIEVNGEALETTAADTTPEYEPVDRQRAREVCISEELLPQLDNYVVKIAKRRKRFPRACCNAVSQFANHQALYMSKVKPSAQKIDLDPVRHQVKDATRFIGCHQLQGPCAALTKLTKTSPTDQERAVHLSKAVEIEAANRHCQTAAAFSHASSPLNAVNSSVRVSCSCKRMLEPDGLDIDSVKCKIARSSFVLARDFVVQPSAI